MAKFLFQIFYGKSLKQMLLALKISLQRGKQQALAKTTGTAQEITTASLNKFVYLSCLVYIYPFVLA